MLYISYPSPLPLIRKKDSIAIHNKVEQTLYDTETSKYYITLVIRKKYVYIYLF